MPVAYVYASSSALTTYEQVRERVRTNTTFRLLFYGLSPLYVLDAKLCYLSLSYMFATFAMVRTPTYFCFHLFDIVFKSHDLQQVWKAISQNGRSILMTVAFMFIVIYVYEYSTNKFNL